MRHSSASRASRGQVYPVPALVAVVALTMALTVYANVATTPITHDQPSPAVPALKQIEDAATTGALLAPRLLDHTDAGLDGYHVNVTLRTRYRVVSSGPDPPADAARATVPVAVSNSTHVVPGTLSVEVWPWPAA